MKVSIPDRCKRFSSAKYPDRVWCPHGLLFNVYPRSFPGVQQPMCEVDQSPQSSVQITNDSSCSPTPPTSLHGVDRDNFAFFLLHVYENINLITTDTYLSPVSNFLVRVVNTGGFVSTSNLWTNLFSREWHCIIRTQINACQCKHRAICSRRNRCHADDLSARNHGERGLLAWQMLLPTHFDMLLRPRAHICGLSGMNCIWCSKLATLHKRGAGANLC